MINTKNLKMFQYDIINGMNTKCVRFVTEFCYFLRFVFAKFYCIINIKQYIY